MRFIGLKLARGGSAIQRGLGDIINMEERAKKKNRLMAGYLIKYLDNTTGNTVTSNARMIVRV